MSGYFKHLYFVKKVLFILFLFLISFEINISQNNNIIDLNISQNRRICVNSIINKPENIQLAIENTKKLNPPLYAEMSFKKKSTILEENNYQIGEKKDFFTYNLVSRSFDKIVAELIVSGDLANIWVDTLEIKNNHITYYEVSAILKDIEISTPLGSRDTNKGIFKIENEYFGLPPNINSLGERGKGNGKVDVLILDIKDGYTGDGDYVAGYFFANDQTVYQYGSNKRDILYLDSYPTIFNRDLRKIDIALQTASHEYQHLIQYNYKGDVVTNDRAVFINEACSQNAEWLCGYNVFNGINASDFFSQTNVYLLSWQNRLSDYSRATLWLMYLIEQLGDGITKTIVQSSSLGYENIIEAINHTQTTSSFFELLKSWSIANYLNNTKYQKKYGYLYPVNGTASARVVKDTSFKIENVTVSPLGSDYVLYSNKTKNFQFMFWPSLTNSSLSIRMVASGTDTIKIMEIVPRQQYSVPEFAGIFDKIAFVITNTNNAQTEQYSLYSSGELLTIPKKEEISYDSGVPIPLDGDPYLFLPFQKSGWAVRFTPKYEANKLLKIRFWAAFGQEINNSSYPTPQDAPKRFEVHVWNALNESTPGTDLIQPVIYTCNRPNTLPSAFIDIDLSSYSYSLSNLKGSIFVGLVEDDDYYTWMAINNSTKTNYSYVRGIDIDPNLWNSMSALKISDSQGFPISLDGWNVMIRAEFMYQTPDGIKYVSEEEPDYQLDQNFPNPFNPETNIQYSIQKPGIVSLTIYDILGRKVKDLVSGYQQSGKYIVTWNGDNNLGNRVSSGIYLYKLEVGNYSSFKKLNLLR